MAKKKAQKVRGTKDVLPEEHLYFTHIENIFEDTAKRAGYGKITLPTLEHTEIFTKSIGENTEIVEKEMYVFEDKSGNSVSLRPEGTAGIARAYIEEGMKSWSQPVKLYYFGPFFRYDRPQAGRYREFYQFGLEVLGDKNPLADAELIALVWRIYKKIGLENINIQINSIGCSSCRPKYIKLLKKYYEGRTKKLCKDCRKRLKENPLRMFDCKEKGCESLKSEAPQMINNLCNICHDHFKTVLEYLDELEISYILNPNIVRGLDYYTRTVFEIWSKSKGGQSSLGGGGRYDKLIEMFGGSSTPALGFAGGVERTIEEMKKEKQKPKDAKPINIFVAQLGEKARKKCFKLLNDLRDAGVGVDARFDKGGIGEQLKIASRLGVDYTLLIGQREAYDDTVIIKDMISGNQEVVPYDKIIKETLKRTGQQ